MEVPRPHLITEKDVDAVLAEENKVGDLVELATDLQGFMGGMFDVAETITNPEWRRRLKWLASQLGTLIDDIDESTPGKLSVSTIYDPSGGRRQ